MPTNSTAQPTLDDAAATTAAATTAKFDQAIGELKDRAGRVAQDTMQSLRTHAGPYVDDAGERLATAERYLVDRVQKQPVTATVAVFGVGILIGLLLSGGRSSR